MVESVVVDAVEAIGAVEPIGTVGMVVTPEIFEGTESVEAPAGEGEIEAGDVGKDEALGVLENVECCRNSGGCCSSAGEAAVELAIGDGASEILVVVEGVGITGAIGVEGTDGVAVLTVIRVIGVNIKREDFGVELGELRLDDGDFAGSTIRCGLCVNCGAQISEKAQLGIEKRGGGKSTRGCCSGELLFARKYPVGLSLRDSASTVAIASISGVSSKSSDSTASSDRNFPL